MSARARAARALHPFAAGVLCCALAFGAAPAWCGWQTFGLADGVVTTQLTAVAQDSSENIWLGSNAGASRYDGVVFRTVTTADGLVGDDIQTIVTDRTGRVWFGTLNGVSVLNNGAWTRYTVNDGLASNNVRGIFQDQAGRMWFATADGASRFDGTTWTSFHQSDGLAGNQLTCILQDRGGDMWFGTETGGASRWTGTTWTTYSAATTSGGVSDNIRCMLEARNGDMWFGTKFGGLSRFTAGSWTRIDTAGRIGFVDVTSLREDLNGAVWVSCDVGIARFDGLAWRSFSTADGLAAALVKSIDFDDLGNLWAATDAGASRYDGESWTSFTQPPNVADAIEDVAGMIWMATGAGAMRYDRATWITFDGASTGGGLASDNVTAALQDSAGALWFGTGAGASRLSNGTWQTFTTTDGLVGNNVTKLARDSSGAVWIGTFSGLSRYDGTTWTSYTSANGLPTNRVRSLLIARDGSVWCGTGGGVARFRSGTWTTFSTTDGLIQNQVNAILEDRTGAMWFGTQAGLSRFNGTSWSSWTIANGLGADVVRSLAETPDGVLWVGTEGGGVSRFDGSLWHTYTTSDGLIGAIVVAALVEHSGNLWFGTPVGASLFETPRVPPQTVVTVPPPPLSANRLQTVPFVAAYRQTLGIEFSTALDSDPWSGWSRDAVWVGRDLVDGVHTLHVRSRNALNFVDPTPAQATFEVAATPPIPQLTAPGSRDPARDTLLIRGTANALRFRSLKLEMRPAGAQGWEPPITVTLAESQTPVVDGLISRLSTRDYPDGDYELRLTVQDTLGLIGYDQVTFIVDNQEPYAVQTTPAVVSALGGGDVFTTNREAHVYIPPRALDRDATITIAPIADGVAPGTQPDGATLVGPGVTLSMMSGTENVPLQKPAILDVAVSIATISFPTGNRLAFYAAGADNVWTRIGGTLDETSDRFSTIFNFAGNYAIYAAPADATLPVGLSVNVTPRVLSARGSIAASSVKIAFVMAKSGTARVTVHNRAGRLIRVVMDGQPLAPGTNLVSWDGRDTDAHDVEAGVYLVTVEALGEKKTSTLGVVR